MRSISDEEVWRYCAVLGCDPALALPPRAVREIKCPRCHAPSGEACCNRNRGRKKIEHAERCLERMRLLMGQLGFHRAGVR